LRDLAARSVTVLKVDSESCARIVWIFHPFWENLVGMNMPDFHHQFINNILARALELGRKISSRPGRKLDKTV
jgi:hypothetical protein